MSRSCQLVLSSPSLRVLITVIQLVLALFVCKDLQALEDHGGPGGLQ